MSQSAKSLSYADAGVDIDKGNQFINEIKPLAATLAHTKGSMNGLDGFGALFDIGAMGYTDPVLVSGADGVGTKLKLAIDMQQHETIGIDLVAMCVNDILVHGAQPLFFLDYFACGELKIDHAREVISGIVEGCKRAGCTLAGGETAEMPGMYNSADYDLAGFCVGAVEKTKIIDGRHTITPGDILIGIASSGPHANGYSLIRKIMTDSGTDMAMKLDNSNRTLGEVLITPTKIYANAIKQLLNDCPDRTVKALAHITGGGIEENLPRVIPKNTKACINPKTWEQPEIFKFLQKMGNVAQKEMYRTFNCGIGMIACIDPSAKQQAIKSLQASGEDVFEIGHIEHRDEEMPVHFI